MAKINETLYAKYIKGRQGSEILESETGFVIYKITGEECFIVDMFIEPSLRGTGKGRELINDLVSLATFAGCKLISANIHLFDVNASKTLLSALHVGFEVVKAEVGILVIILNLQENK